MLLALSALWGASFMFIKIGVRELEPTTLVALRLGIGALTIAPLALGRVGVRETGRQLRAAAWPLVLTGLVVGAQPSGELVGALAVVFSALCSAVAAIYVARGFVPVPPLVPSFGALA